MSQYRGGGYQIVAARRGQGDAGQRARLGHRPFLIGSGSAADLRLEGGTIRAVQARLFLTTTGQVMLTNLGEAGSMTLDGVALPSFACIPWKPGALLAIGGYDLHLEVIRAGGQGDAPEIVEHPVITQENRAVEDGVVPPRDAAAASAAGAGAFASAFGRPVPGDGRMAEGDAEDADGPAIREKPAESVAEAAPSAAPQAAIVAAEAPPGTPSPHQPPQPPEEVVAESPVAGLRATLPKDWQYSGLFGVQLPLPAVSLVAGERVRLPISVRNGYTETLHLHIAADGVPPEWVILPQMPLTLAGGEIQTFDVVLQTQPSPFPERVRELRIRFLDRGAPHVMLTATLTLSFKDEPNLVGRLEPVEAVETRPVWLLVQNHTQATTEVFITGHTADATLLVVTPQQAQIRLPQGESVQIGVSFQVLRRPWLRPIVCDYCLTVAHSHRAPLDYPGRVRIRPRLWPSWLLR